MRGRQNRRGTATTTADCNHDDGDGLRGSAKEKGLPLRGPSGSARDLNGPFWRTAAEPARRKAWREARGGAPEHRRQLHPGQTTPEKPPGGIHFGIMSLPPAFHESLPYIDPEPSPSALAAAHALIAAEQATHPAPTPQPTPEKPALPSSESPLDLTRYEAQEPAPSSAVPPQTLSAAYVSASYLASRAQHLELLDAHGRNAWLLANHQLEALLRDLERDLARARADVDRANAARADAQNRVAAEMHALDRDWRRGVAAVLETEVAVEELRGRIREELAARARAGAGGDKAH